MMKVFDVLDRIAYLCGALLAVIALSWIFERLVSHFGANAGNWAAWVQALGAIVAIAGAAWIGLHQVQAARRQEAARRKQSLEAVVELFRQFEITLADTLKELESKGFTENARLYAGERKRALAACISAIDAMPLHEIPYAYIGHRAFNLRNAMDHALDIAQSIADLRFDLPEGNARFQIRLNLLRTDAANGKACYDAIARIEKVYDGWKAPDLPKNQK